jgi:hypothetical protein
MAMIEESDTNHPDLRAIAEKIHVVAQARQGDSVALLALLRMLEQAHRDIREGLFQEALPTNRQALHALLRDIETQGGWPYIYSRQLRMLLNALVATAIQPEPDSDRSPGLPDETKTPSRSEQTDVIG